MEFAGVGPGHAWTIRHAVEGVQIFGGIGSGKTSGSGRMLALKYLKAGFGGLVLTVKPDEREMWEEYCRMVGREKDLLILEPGGVHSFNFLDYESSQGAAITENIVEVLQTVIRAGERKDSGVSDDPFWETALDLLLYNTIDLCQLAYGTVTVPRMYDIVQTIPKKAEEFEPKPGQTKKAFHEAFQIAREKTDALYDVWEKKLTDAQREAHKKHPGLHEAELLEAVPQARLFKMVNQFFAESFVQLSEKTRSIIDFTFAGFLFRLLREPFYSLFCQYGSTLTPEDSLRGKVILLDLPVKIYNKAGRDCQILFKYIWQRAMERRNVKSNGRPLFLWADEAQNFLHEHDAVYQATARSSRIATVYITQNLPNYRASMGGEQNEDRVMGFLGTLGTKIFHANADIQTNNYASELIGETEVEKVSRTVQIGTERSESQAIQTQYERMVRPFRLVSLATGGPQNAFKVEGYFHKQGDPLFDTRNFKKLSFNQHYKPA